jgi:hypothetical protein
MELTLFATIRAEKSTAIQIAPRFMLRLRSPKWSNDKSKLLDGLCFFEGRVCVGAQTCLLVQGLEVDEAFLI